MKKKIILLLIAGAMAVIMSTSCSNSEETSTADAMEMEKTDDLNQSGDLVATASSDQLAEPPDELIIEFISSEEENVVCGIWHTQYLVGSIISSGENYHLNDNEVFVSYIKNVESESMTISFNGPIFENTRKITENITLWEFKEEGFDHVMFAISEGDMFGVTFTREIIAEEQEEVKTLWSGTEQDGIIEIVSEYYEIAEGEWHNSTTNTVNDGIRYYAELYNNSNYLVRISDCYLDIYDENMSEIKHTVEIDFVVSKYINPGDNAYISLNEEFVWSEFNAYAIASASAQRYEYVVNTYDPEEKHFTTDNRNGELENIILDEGDKYVLRYKVTEVDEKEYIDIQIKDVNVEVNIQKDATDFGWIKKVTGTMENNSDYDLSSIFYAIIVKQEEKIIGIYSNGCFLGTYYLPIESLNSKEECNFELDEIAYNIPGGWIIDNTKEISYELKVLDYDMVPKN